ncbi:MAG: DUF4365 domain-containing protein [Deltaproteobacteria bacterium]|nr:DUF4365 domain-containing protein [Deltaproteobacteria bacterium]
MPWRPQSRRWHCIWREQPIADFGIDGHIELVDESGRPTGQLVGVQVKSGSSYFTTSDSSTVAFYASREHWAYWSTHALPVVVVLHNPESKETIWQWATPESAVDTGKMRRIDVPRHQTLDSRHCGSLKNRGPLGSAAARRQRFALAGC